MAGDRGDDGRFCKGWQGGPGRPRNGTGGGVREFRKMLRAHLPEIMTALIEQAKSGDNGSIKMVLDRLYPITIFQLNELETRIAELETLLNNDDESRT